MTRTSGLDFGLDPAQQWDTKHELFHLAEICAPPSAILLCAVLLSCHSVSDFYSACAVYNCTEFEMSPVSSTTSPVGPVSPFGQLI